MSASLEMVPPALITNTRANRVLHEQVVLVNVKTVGLPHVSDRGRDRDHAAAAWGSWPCR